MRTHPIVARCFLTVDDRSFPDIKGEGINDGLQIFILFVSKDHSYIYRREIMEP